MQSTCEVHDTRLKALEERTEKIVDSIDELSSGVASVRRMTAAVYGQLEPLRQDVQALTEWQDTTKDKRIAELERAANVSSERGFQSTKDGIMGLLTFLLGLVSAWCATHWR